MSPKEDEQWELDEIIMKYWDASSAKEKKKIELECYKKFKQHGFQDNFINYLNENGCEELANEMKHFMEIYQKVPHEHEKRQAA